MDEALSLYKLLVNDAERHRGELLRLMEIGKTVETRLRQATTYVRAWH